MLLFHWNDAKLESQNCSQILQLLMETNKITWKQKSFWVYICEVIVDYKEWIGVPINNIWEAIELIAIYTNTAQESTG